MANIEMKTAVSAAKNAFCELFSDDLPEELALEEIDLTNEKGRNLWAVTFGFYRKKSLVKSPPGKLTDLFQQPTQIENRVYKTVYVDAEDGSFVKMDMRLI